MSEEQSGFKVTDRRLFNADGTPREVAQEEASAPKTTTDTPPESEVASQAAPSDVTTADSPAPAEDTRSSETARTEESAPAKDTAAADSEHEDLSEDAYAEGDIPGADDPASFVNFLMSIASNAAAALGMMEHPVTGQRGVDLPLGKHWIDVLGMLQEKTRGNLSPQEEQIFKGLLADLRMQFVSLTRASMPKRPGGFSGSDILGGK